MKSIILTGAAGGVGTALVPKLIKEGFVVYAGIIDDWERERITRQIEVLDTELVIPVMLDLRNREHIENVVSQVEVNHPEFAGVIVNGAFSPAGVPFEYLEEEILRNVLEVNVIGNLLLMQRCLNLLKKSQGRIIYVSSILGKVAGAMQMPYSASKHACESFMTLIRRELSRFGIKTVLINPGLVHDTFMAARQYEGGKRGVAAMDGCKPGDVAAFSFDEGKNTAVPKVKVISDRTYRQDFAGLMKASLPGLGPKHSLSCSPDDVADNIMKGLMLPKPKLRYFTGADAKLLAILNRIFSDSIMDKLADKITMGD